MPELEVNVNLIKLSYWANGMDWAFMDNTGIFMDIVWVFMNTIRHS